MSKQLFLLLFFSSVAVASSDKKSAQIIVATSKIAPKICKTTGYSKNFGPWITYSYSDNSMSCTRYLLTGELLCVRLVTEGKNMWGEHIDGENYYELEEKFEQQEISSGH